ncbi:SpoIIIAH-like family protein, partial [Dysosmobacter welbionis]
CADSVRTGGAHGTDRCPQGAEDQRGDLLCQDGNPCHRSQSQGAGPCRRGGPGGPGCGLLCRLRRDALQGQNGRRGGRREFRRRRRPAFEPYRRKGGPGAPQGPAAGHEDLPRATDTGRERGIPLEQHCYGAAARREADRHPAAGCADRGGIRPSLRRALHQRRQKAGHGAGERPAGAGCRRLCDGGRN